MLLRATDFSGSLPPAYSLFMAERSRSHLNLVLQVRGMTGKHHQVARLVVPLVPVNVVDSLALAERPSKLLLGNDAMDRLCSDFGVIGRARGFVSPTTRRGAVDATTTVNFDGFGKEGCAATLANSLLLATATHRIASLGAPSADTRLPASLTCVVHGSIVRSNAVRINTRFSPHCVNPERIRYPLFGL